VQSEDSLSSSDIKKRAIKSMKWTVLGEVVSRSFQPLITLILAWFLSPGDLGVVGIAMMTIALAQMFQEFGVGKSIIQRETEVEESANVFFWTNLALSLFLYTAIFLSAPLLAKFFREPKIVDILRVLSLKIILFSFISVHQGLFQRKFKFKHLFFVRLLSGFVVGVVSISLAWLGYGVWSLIFGILAGTLIQVLLVWKLSPWRPSLSYDFKLARRVLLFGGWITLEALLGWLMVWGDSVILGRFLGVTTLGTYRLGVIFMSLAFGLFLNPILLVAYSSLSRLQASQTKLKEFFIKTTRLIATFALPVGMIFVCLSRSLSSVVFGEKWAGIEVVFLVLGIKDVLTSIVGSVNVEVLRAIGRPDINVKLLIFSAIFFIPVYIFAAPYGLLVFCYARFAVAIVTVLLYLFATHKVLKVSLLYPLACSRPQLIAVFVMCAVIFLFKGIIAISNLHSLLAVVIVAMFSYTLTLFLITKNSFTSTLKYVYSIFRE